MIEYRIGDVFDRLAEIPDDSVDLIVTSPPFLALRSYLPADHPDKNKEIGSEATPADFLQTLLDLTAEWQRVLAPHGSLCVELGDTYSGSGGGGGDYLPGGLRADQPGFGGSAERQREGNAAHWRAKNAQRDAWPLAKSKTMIDTLYPACLSYGRNLLNGNPAPQLRIRNLIVWARPNPPVGALGDKFRPATSYITVASMGPKRYFDLDAVRTENPRVDEDPGGYRMVGGSPTHDAGPRAQNPAGAPPLDWHADDHPEDGDWLWKLSTQPYKGSHYATFPMALPKRLIEAMCPQRVCVECGKPSERIVELTSHGEWRRPELTHTKANHGGPGTHGNRTRSATTLGWSDCGHNNWRTGIVLDPFGGSGTTLDAAQAVGRHAIAIDLDERNADLARERVGMFMEVVA